MREQPRMDFDNLLQRYFGTTDLGNSRASIPIRGAADAGR